MRDLLIQKLRESMEGLGIKSPSNILTTGKFHRFNVDTGSTIKGSKTGWYRLSYNKDNEEIFVWGDWRDSGLSNIVVGLNNEERVSLSPEQKAEISKNRYLEKRKSKSKRKDALDFVEYISKNTKDIDRFSYFSEKGYTEEEQKLFSLKKYKNSLVIPVYSSKSGLLINYQRITKTKPMLNTLFSMVKPFNNNMTEINAIKSYGFDKRFIDGSSKKGGFYIIGQESQKIDPNIGYYGLVEGYATGMTAYLSLSCSMPIIVCFDNKNLENIVQILNSRYPDLFYLNFSDNDAHTAIKRPKVGNPGLDMAHKLKRVYGIDFLYPRITDKQAEYISDFDDYRFYFGMESLRESMGLQIDEIQGEASATEELNKNLHNEIQKEKELLISNIGLPESEVEDYINYEPKSNADALRFIFER